MKEYVLIKNMKRKDNKPMNIYGKIENSIEIESMHEERNRIIIKNI